MGTIQRKASKAMNKTSDAASNFVSGNQKDWIKKFARLGMASKGVVYGLLGTLTAMAALNMGGGQTTDKKGIVQWLAQQPYGQIMLGLLALGLLCYLVWRFYEAFADPEKEGKDIKGIIKRTGYAISGIIYGAIAYYSAKLIFDALGSSGGGGNSQQTIVDKILSQPAGQWIVGIIALIIVGKGLYQFYQAVSGRFKERLNETKLGPKEREAYKRAGYVGLIARGIVFFIIGYFFLKAAIESDASEAQGTSGAFDFLQGIGGNLAMGLVALGLLAYGIFMIIKARYGAIALR